MRLRPWTVACLAAGMLGLAAGTWFSLCQHAGFAPPAAETERIDVNLSDANEWAALPGVGPVLAMRIVALRNRSGGFISHEELLAVKGIGPKKFSRLKPYLLPVDIKPTE